MLKENLVTIPHLLLSKGYSEMNYSKINSGLNSFKWNQYNDSDKTSLLFRKYRMKNNQKEFQFSVLLGSDSLNIINPKSEVMWLTLNYGKKKVFHRIGISLPNEIIKQMIFLYATPSYLSIEIDQKQKKKKIVKKVKFSRNDNGKVIIEPDLNSNEFKFITCKKEMDDTYYLDFELSNYINTIKQNSSTKIYKLLTFYDTTTKGKLKYSLPLLVS